MDGARHSQADFNYPVSKSHESWHPSDPKPRHTSHQRHQASRTYNHPPFHDGYRGGHRPQQGRGKPDPVQAWGEGHTHPYREDTDRRPVRGGKPKRRGAQARRHSSESHSSSEERLADIDNQEHAEAKPPEKSRQILKIMMRPLVDKESGDAQAKEPSTAAPTEAKQHHSWMKPQPKPPTPTPPPSQEDTKPEETSEKTGEEKERRVLIKALSPTEQSTSPMDPTFNAPWDSLNRGPVSTQRKLYEPEGPTSEKKFSVYRRLHDHEKKQTPAPSGSQTNTPTSPVVDSDKVSLLKGSSSSGSQGDIPQEPKEQEEKKSSRPVAGEDVPPAQKKHTTGGYTHSHKPASRGQGGDFRSDGRQRVQKSARNKGEKREEYKQLESHDEQGRRPRRDQRPSRTVAEGQDQRHQRRTHDGKGSGDRERQTEGQDQRHQRRTQEGKGSGDRERQTEGQDQRHQRRTHDGKGSGDWERQTEGQDQRHQRRTHDGKVSGDWERQTEGQDQRHQRRTHDGKGSGDRERQRRDARQDLEHYQEGRHRDKDNLRYDKRNEGRYDKQTLPKKSVKSSTSDEQASTETRKAVTYKAGRLDETKEDQTHQEDASLQKSKSFQRTHPSTKDRSNRNNTESNYYSSQSERGQQQRRKRDQHFSEKEHYGNTRQREDKQSYTKNERSRNVRNDEGRQRDTKGRARTDQKKHSEPSQNQGRQIERGEPYQSEGGHPKVGRDQRGTGKPHQDSKQHTEPSMPRSSSKGKDTRNRISKAESAKLLSPSPDAPLPESSKRQTQEETILEDSTQNALQTNRLDVSQFDLHSAGVFIVDDSLVSPGLLSPVDDNEFTEVVSKREKREKKDQKKQSGSSRMQPVKKQGAAKDDRAPGRPSAGRGRGKVLLSEPPSQKSSKPQGTTDISLSEVLPSPWDTSYRNQAIQSPTHQPSQQQSKMTDPPVSPVSPSPGVIGSGIFSPSAQTKMLDSESKLEVIGPSEASGGDGGSYSLFGNPILVPPPIAPPGPQGLNPKVPQRLFDRAVQDITQGPPKSKDTKSFQNKPEDPPPTVTKQKPPVKQTQGSEHQTIPHEHEVGRGRGRMGAGRGGGQRQQTSRQPGPRGGQKGTSGQVSDS